MGSTGISRRARIVTRGAAKRGSRHVLPLLVGLLVLRMDPTSPRVQVRHLGVRGRNPKKPDYF